MAFNNPAWLWGLVGLAIPLAIHLLSRKEGQVIRMGSIRFLNESATQQFKSLKLNEIVLLIIRMIVVGLLVLFLSELMMSKNSDRENWVLIDPQLKASKFVSELIDSLEDGERKIKLLQDGFPEFDNRSIKEESVDYWGIVEKLKHESFNEAIVVSNSSVAGFWGDRVAKPDNIKWISVPSEEITKSVYANRFNKDSIRLTELTSDQNLTQFKTEEIFWPKSKLYYKNNSDSILIDTTKTNVLIHYDEDFSHDAEIIYKSLELVKHQAKLNGVITLDNTADYKEYDCLIWLSGDKFPTEFTGKLISFQNSDGKSLIEQTGANQWVITNRINSNLATTKHLPLELAKIIINRNANLVSTNDQRVIPEGMMWSSASDKVLEKNNQKSASNYLLLMLIIVIALERTVAYLRKA